MYVFYVLVVPHLRIQAGYGPEMELLSNAFYMVRIENKKQKLQLCVSLYFACFANKRDSTCCSIY